MSLFFRKNDNLPRINDEQVEQLRREFASQMQALQQTMQQNIQIAQQNMQAMQQSLSEEIQQLTQKRVSYWTSAQSIIEQLQRQIRELSRRIALFAPDALPTGEKNLGELHMLDIQKAQIAIRALTEYGSTHKEIDKAFDSAQQKRDKERENLQYSAANIFLPAVQDTDKIQAIEAKKEEIHQKQLRRKKRAGSK